MYIRIYVYVCMVRACVWERDEDSRGWLTVGDDAPRLSRLKEDEGTSEEHAARAVQEIFLIHNYTYT